MPAHLPMLTGSLEGTGGRFKVDPEDFIVEEIPAYPPSGAGEHLFLWIEKRDLTTEQVVSHLATRLQIPARSIGTAGLKDKRAITRQFFSVPAVAGDCLGDVETPQLCVLSAEPHSNKLKTGHLKENRFDVRLRDIRPNAEKILAAKLSVLRKKGYPNYYGEQRFGRDNRTLELGRKILAGTADARGNRRRLAVSAVQSAVFNAVLAERLSREEFAQVLAGDVLQKTQTGGLFVCTSPEDDQPRFDAGEIVPTGPMFGPRMPAPSGSVADRESEILARFDLPADAFLRFPKLTRGTRRPLLVHLQELSANVEDDRLRLCFTLRSGSYATVVLREIMEEAPEVNAANSDQSSSR